MASIKYNVKGVDPGGDRPLPKPGVHRCKVISCVDAKPSGKDRRLEVQYQITEGDSKGFIIYDYINLESEAAQWKLAQFIKAMGLPETGKLDPDELVGTGLSIRVRVQPGDEQYGPSAKAATLMPLDTDGDEEDLSDAEGEGDETETETESEDEDQGDEDEDEDEETYSQEELEELDDDDLIDVALGYTDEDGDEIEGILDTEERDVDDYIEEKTTGKGKKKKTERTIKDRDDLIAALLEDQGDEDEDEDEGGEDETPDYESMELADLRKLAKERKLSTKGSKKAIIARLQKDDNPF